MTISTSLRRVIRAIRELRELYPDIPAATIEVFLLVAANAGLSSKELQQRARTSQSSISRHLTMLTDHSWNGKTGIGLIDLIEDPRDRRTKRAFLNSKGVSVSIKIAALVDPDADEPSPSEFLSSKEYVASVKGSLRKPV